MNKIIYNGCELIKVHGAIQVAYKCSAAAKYAKKQLEHSGLKDIVRYDNTLTIYTKESLEQFVWEFRRFVCWIITEEDSFYNIYKNYLLFLVCNKKI